jgi:hypothetical protein
MANATEMTSEDLQRLRAANMAALAAQPKKAKKPSKKN